MHTNGTDVDNRSWMQGVANGAISAAPPTERYTPPDPEPVELAAPTGDANARPKRAAAVFAVATLAAGAAVIGLTNVVGNHPDPQPVSQDDPTVAAAPVSPGPSAATATPGQADLIPFTASDHCPLGSTQPQLLADTSTDSWWICVRGSLGAELDGQILHLDFGKPEVITSIEIVPGAMAKTRGGHDEWDHHRVVHVLQYNFCNGEVCVPVSQDTTDGHGGPVPKGPVPKLLEHPVLASSVDVIIQQTDRPTPADPPAQSPLDPSAPEAPTPTTPDQGNNPVDYTVAVGSLKFFGYPPTGQ